MLKYFDRGSSTNLSHLKMVCLTKKVDINLGYGCNAKCPFCYYYDSVVTGENLNTLTTEQAKEQLRQAKRFDIEEIEFTGGEVSLRKDFAELVAYAKNELKFKVVAMVTNGIVLANFDYLKVLADSGLDDVLFSVHGHTAEMHDQLTVTKGSFSRIMQAIDHATRLGLRVRTNTVVCKTNYQYLEDIFQLLINKKVDNINLIAFNPIIQARNQDVISDLYVSYTEVGNSIMRAIARHRSALPHLNIRYLPPCFVPGYEQYVTNLDQMNFDPDEWNNYVSFRIRKGRWISWAVSMVGIWVLPFKRYAARHGLRGLLMAGMGRFYTFKDKVKSQKCQQCAYENVCDYLWKGYYDIYGDKEIQPVPGEKVSNPAWSMIAAHIREPGQLPRQTVLSEP